MRTLYKILSLGSMILLPFTTRAKEVNVQVTDDPNQNVINMTSAVG